MNIFWSIILGLVQGITEFLPVSSSGHLVIFQNLIPEFSQPGALFDVVLHFGTMCAVLIYFSKKLIHLIKKYWLAFIVGTIPAGLVGIFFQGQIESLFTNIRFVGLALMITGVFNFITDITKTDDKNITYKNSFFVGVFQALAIIPGISRSGSTIFAGRLSGISKEKAAEFSFLLSVPAILGANILQFASHGVNAINDPINYFTGFISAFISGYISIGIVLKALHKKQFKYLGIYCFALGLLVLFFSR